MYYYIITTTFAVDGRVRETNNFWSWHRLLWSREQREKPYLQPTRWTWWTDYFCLPYPGIFSPSLYLLASFRFGFSFQRPAVKSCQESLSSAVGLIKRKTNSRFPRLGVARGRVGVLVCGLLYIVCSTPVFSLSLFFSLVFSLSTLLMSPTGSL